jgi:hypothetical protein
MSSKQTDISQNMWEKEDKDVVKNLTSPKRIPNKLGEVITIWEKTYKNEPFTQ